MFITLFGPHYLIHGTVRYFFWPWSKCYEKISETASYTENSRTSGIRAAAGRTDMSRSFLALCDTGPGPHAA